MGIKAAGRRLPGFHWDEMPRGTRQVGRMAPAPERPGAQGGPNQGGEMGGRGPVPGDWRHQPGAVRPEGLLAFGI
eukprot:3660615-Heterocapsa_arctica.AAC.1